MGNVFIIGNGFDLDLGLPTRYSDFAKSEYWPAILENKIGGDSLKNDNYAKSVCFPNPPRLAVFIENAKNRETWFDLEKELLEYAKDNDRTGGYCFETRNEAEEIITQNVEYFYILRNSLNDYILEVQKKQDVGEDSTASHVLKEVVGNGYFENIYSFNYTDLNSIARRIGIAQEINYIHLHGKVLDNSIILT